MATEVGEGKMFFRATFAAASFENIDEAGVNKGFSHAQPR